MLDAFAGELVKEPLIIYKWWRKYIKFLRIGFLRVDYGVLGLENEKTRYRKIGKMIRIRDAVRMLAIIKLIFRFDISNIILVFNHKRKLKGI